GPSPTTRATGRTSSRARAGRRSTAAPTACAGASRRSTTPARSLPTTPTGAPERGATPDALPSVPGATGTARVPQAAYGGHGLPAADDGDADRHGGEGDAPVGAPAEGRVELSGQVRQEPLRQEQPD